MKLHLALFAILGISTIFAQGTQDFPNKCDCHEDNFMAKLLEERRCLLTEDGNGIDNCERTAWDSTHGLACTRCAPGYAIDEKLQCISHELPNCQYGSIAGSNSEFPDYVNGFVCTQCEDGFFPNKEGWCAQNPNDIDNCRVYEQHGSPVNATRCSICNDGTWIKQSDKTSCDDTPADEAAGLIENCELYNNANGQAAGWTCSKCNDGTWIQQSNSKVCASTPAAEADGLIENCERYNNANGLASGWTCTKCNEGTWIQNSDSKKCADTPDTEANGRIENCARYTNANGQASGFRCSECDSGYILNNANDECWETPTSTTEPTTWTENCQTWTHPTTRYECTVCAEHHYLEAQENPDACLPVQRNIPNCIFYSDAQTCVTCEERYWLEDGICVECPAEQYVAPLPIVCDSQGNPVPADPNNPQAPGNGNNNNSNAVILQAGLVIALSVLLL